MDLITLSEESSEDPREEREKVRQDCHIDLSDKFFTQSPIVRTQVLGGRFRNVTGFPGTLEQRVNEGPEEGRAERVVGDRQTSV